MKEKGKNAATELYRRLRVLSCQDLWKREVPRFNELTGRERVAAVGVVRAVGVVFSESGNPNEQQQARQWLRGLLNDPEEKVRRYAMQALPKLPANAEEEREMIRVLQQPASEREKASAARALEKIGGAATLQALTSGSIDPKVSILRRASANVARENTPGSLRWDKRVNLPEHQRIVLHCRSGLESVLEDELGEGLEKGRIVHRGQGLVVIQPGMPVALSDIYRFRCFATAGFCLGTLRNEKGCGVAEALAGRIASPEACRLMESLTDGPARFRLEFASRGHQRALVREVADRVYQRAPALLNDSRRALWEIVVKETVRGTELELRPRVRPDPRFSYRQGDIPAASHPPLAAAMARVAGWRDAERIWDPFCGSGLELIECARRGGVECVVGTDRSERALETARANFAAARLDGRKSAFVCCDFRNAQLAAGVKDLTLVITNPPMGRRVPIPDLPGMMEDLFRTAGELLTAGGRLVLVNPLPIRPPGRILRLDFQQKIDLGGFHVRLEKYTKAS